MLRQNVGSNKRGLGLTRFSSSNFFALPSSGNRSMGRSAKSGSVSSSISHSDCYDSPMVDPEHIMQLVNDVRKFSEVLANLKEAFLSEANKVSLHSVAHERLGELLRVLKAVISKHQSLNSVDILSATGTVISKVKGANYNEVNDDRREHFGDIFASIDTLAFTFGNVISNFLMGDMDNSSSLGVPLTGRSRSFENLSLGSGGSVQERDDLRSTGTLRAEDLDNMLLKIDSGIESALIYTKTWSKYTKDVLAWLEKRLNLDVEYARNFSKLAESAKTSISQPEHMPFQSVYISAFEYDVEYSQLLLQTGAALQTNKFIQPLLLRRNELDKQRKEIKEQWQREQRKMQEADSTLKKARLLHVQRREEYEKAKSSTIRAEEDLTLNGGQVGNYNRQIEKKKKLEEEALQKADEAGEHYKTCISDANEKRSELEEVKSDILTQLRELVYQCDLTLKSVTVNLFQMQHAKVVSLPVNYQSLCENTKLYEPGQQYSEFVKSLPKEEVPMGQYLFESSVPSAGGLTKRTTSSTHSSQGNLSQTSGTSGDLNFQPTDVDGLFHVRQDNIKEKRSNSSNDIQVLRGQGPFRAWPMGIQGSGMCSDSESAGGSSESRSMDSPSASPGDFKRRLPRTPSTGTMSSADDLDEREPPSPSDPGLNDIVAEMPNSPGPFRNTLMSKAAQTHKLRKLRAPSKCRECDSLVVFHGAECEECTLACHKKCLETLAIQCGHKKLLGRLHLFGVDFTQTAKNSSDGIPFIIKKCTSEIESRALNIKGIYRVNGAKSRVEKLCQAFENGKDLVELSDLYAHDISNVLKLYLRQLPEPLISFRLYNEFIGLAKESHNISDEDNGKLNSPNSEKRWLTNVVRIVFRVKDLLRQLPRINYKTLQYLIDHLHKVAEQAEENKMSASNLGIIFGPTLLRPRQTDATVSLSSLVDYPYQAQTVELLITYYDKIFLSSSTPSSPLQKGYPSVDEKDKNMAEEGLSENERLQSTSKVSFGLAGSECDSPEMASSSETFDVVKGLKWNAKDGASGPVITQISEKPVGLLNLQSAQISEAQKSNKSSLINKTSKSHVKVNMRPPRTKPFMPRPTSLPVSESVISYSNDKNSKGLCNIDSIERSPIIEEASELKSHTNNTSTCRHSYYDTQSMRRTWDKQYKCYDITQKTAMIVANVPPEKKTSDLSFSPPLAYTSGNAFASSLHPNKLHTVPGRPVRTTKIDGNVSETVFAFRAPRTLQPPPGTFYIPPTIKQSVDSLSKTLTKLDSSFTSVQGNTGTVIPVKENEKCSNVDKEIETAQNTAQEEVEVEHKPAFQRLRSKRIPPEYEHREAHFV
ncbi:rho GTPase-activating protein 29 [Callorhinchus milii]|uniref:rho GTPase-activating protein 29 n=1 Tax=Callorhinchus milii TaxID=7868 RepID=UPI001C3F5F7A|nr:rho GTPase-activating protein 29 [Callorhinchus milii]XP_007885318.2 rho GTPase-activating protein 29 [Callorhinchus milii]